VRSANLLSGNTKACGCQHFHDLMGRVFGRLTVLRRAPNVGRRTRWIVQCGCGSPEKPVGADYLIDGRTVSCGCHRAVSIGNRLRTHGRTHTREYRIWCNMRRRCEDPNNPAYSNYGGRGITVAPEFQTFEGFFACVGLSNGLSLDRINNDLGYSPSNVRWADRVTQGRNRRSNRLITFNGKTQPISAWAAEMGLSDRTLAQRVDSWPLEKAMTAPKNSSIRRAERTRGTKNDARISVRKAVKSGQLIKHPCAECGNPNTQGHHADYADPLKVTWLCRKHHGLAHRKP
jgi:hypothetical protein